MRQTSNVERPTSLKRPRTRKIEPGSNPAPERPRILGVEEKRQLILAHSEPREPVDSAQRFSLWAGVAVCFLAIAVGWIYSMRQTIAGAFDSPVAQTIKDFKTDGTDGTQLQKNIDELMNHLNTAQSQSAAELQAMQAVAAQVQEVASSSAARQDLFKPATAPSTSKTPNLPSGVKVENY